MSSAFLMACGPTPAHAAAMAAAPAAGVSRELAQQRAASIGDLRYDLSLSIPGDPAQPISAVGVVQFRLASVPDPLVLDFDPGSPSPVSIEANGQPAGAIQENGHLLVPAARLQLGENTLKMRFSAGDAPLNRGADLVYTLFVPARARQAWPCFDQPDLKGRWTLTLEHPAHWQSSANGAQIERRTIGQRVQVRFAPTPPLPSYLVAFVAGAFEVETAQRGGRAMRMLHRETDPARLEANREALFDLHARALDELERYTGIAYPFGKFDFVLIPSLQYGGMEHPANILYDSDLLLLDGTATQDDQLRRASLIAHETAHMWFGDLVTMRWFDDVWIKEVFANFMAARLVGPSFPDINHDLRFFLSYHRPAYGIDRSQGANPIRQNLDNLLEAAQLYGPIIYCKAPVVLRQIEALLGEAAFRDGVREYLATYAFGNATWDDLIAIFCKRTALDLKAFGRVWIDTPGRPTIRTERLERGGRLEGLWLRQADPAGMGRIWPQQLRVVAGCAGERRLIVVEMSGESVDLAPRLGHCDLQYVLPGGEGWGYADFVLDPASLDYLAASLYRIDDTLTRAAAWAALVDAMLDGRLAPERLYETLMQALANESDEQLAASMLSDLSMLWWRFFPDSLRRERAERLESVLRRGIERSESSSWKAAWLRELSRIAITPGTLQWLHSLWSGSQTIKGMALAESDQISLAEELAVRQVEGWSAIVDRQAARIGNPDRRARLQFIRLALSPDPQDRAGWLAALRQPQARRHEAWVIEGLHFLHHPLRADASAALVRPGLDMLVQIQQTGDIFFPARWLLATLSGHSSPQVASDVQSFLNELPAGYPDRLRELVLQAADPLFRAALIRFHYPG